LRRLKKFGALLRKGNTRLMLLFAVLIMTASSIVLYFERAQNSSLYGNLWDSVWWTLVTVFTVGYGDIFPRSTGGRLVGIIIMFMGVSMISLITATISSIFVTKKIREGQGLESFDYEDHIIICGWNNRTEPLMDTMFTLSRQRLQIVLVNELPEAEINSILDKFAKRRVKFIRGDYTRTAPLERANIKRAAHVILVPNLVQYDATDADEKTVLATLNIKSSYPKVRVIAFILNPDNEVHVKRAKADDVIVSDRFADYFIASNILQPGLPKVFDQILDPKTQNNLNLENIPARFVGKKYTELFQHYRSQQKALLIGLLTQVESIGLTDFLSSDTSHIDAFIERKLREAGKSIGEENKILVNLNPDDNYIVQANEKAIILR